MADLLHLSAPWWHFVLRAIVIYVMVMVLIRVSGKRAVGPVEHRQPMIAHAVDERAPQHGSQRGDGDDGPAQFTRFPA